MTQALEIGQQIKATLSASINEIILHLPSIAGAMLLLLAGWLIARFIKLITLKLMALLNHFLARILAGRGRAAIRFSTGISHLVAGVLFWVTLFIFFTAAMRIIGLTAIANWLEQLVIYLPTVISAALIILFGYILSSFVHNAALTTAQTAELQEAHLIARLAQAVIFITSIIIGINQLGIDVTFLTIMLGITTACLLLGFAIAFGLGAKVLVSNLIAAYHLREHVEVGHKVRIGEIEGTVLEISNSTLIIDTVNGRTSVPAKRYQEENVTVLVEETHDK